jgi:hypothetical protein
VLFLTDEKQPAGFSLSCLKIANGRNDPFSTIFPFWSGIWNGYTAEMFIEEETACATHATHATQKSASTILRDLRCVRDGRCILHRYQLHFYHTIPPVLVGCGSLF